MVLIMAEREGSSLPSPGLIAAVLVIAGAVVVNTLALQPSRPTSTDKVTNRYATAQDVDARLWQDPFAAADRHQEEFAKSRSQNASAGASLHAPFNVIDELSKRPRTEIIVVAAPVFGGPYVDTAEHRRRIRYAILAGLNVEAGKYVPEDAEHVGYFELADAPDRRRHGPPEIVPYEWFHEAKEDRHRLVVLWLDEGELSDEPLAKIGSVMTTLGVDCNQLRPRGLRFVVLGPNGSDTLQRMFREAVAPRAPPPIDPGPPRRVRHRSSRVETPGRAEAVAAAQAPDTTPNPRGCLNGAEIYSYSATASIAQLMDANYTDARIAADFDDRLGITFFRTILPDQVVLGSVLEELERRGVDTKSRQTHVALISEWDSLYGQKFGDSLSYALCAGRGDTAPGMCARQIHSFSYLRGLDGVLPRGPSTPPPAKDAAAKTERGPVEHAEGDSQYDYLRRLAEQVRRADRQLGDGAKIHAIGVVGTDVYDKLLVLQAVRPAFPDAVFFTTDLDARLFHAEQFTSARNLVVASTHGLRLHPNFQRDIPPFRDSYQTSAFLAMQLALERPEPPLRRIGQEEINGWLRPRVFEIGRNMAFDLTPTPAAELAGSLTQRCTRFVGCARVQPNRDDFFPSLGPLSWDVSAILVGAGLLLLFGGSRPLRQAIGEGLTRLREHPRWGITLGVAAVGLVTLVGWTAQMIVREGDSGEPFLFLAGISVWPTELLRAVAAVLALAFVVRVRVAVNATTRRLNHDFFAPEMLLEEHGLRRQDLAGRQVWGLIGRLFPGQPAPPDAKSVQVAALWQEYVFQSSGLGQALRILPFCIAFYVFCWKMVELFGIPQPPIRGALTATVDTVLLGTCITGLIVLLFMVVDTTRLCMRFIREVSRRIETQWPPNVVARYRTRDGADDADLGRWLDVRFIASWTETIGTLFYYPCVVMLLMLGARSAIFDKWSTPPGLLIVFALVLLYAIGCGWLLRRTAERARVIVLECLNDSLLKAKGEARQPAVAQLDMMIKEVETTRRGAFGSLLQQPLIQAALLPLSGASGIAVLEYFLLGR